MYYIYTDGFNNFNEEFLKLGVRIRKLNTREKTVISNIYRQMCKKKNTVIACIRAHKNNILKYRELKSQIDMDDNVIELLYHEWRFHDKKPVFHKDITVLFKKLMVVEIDEKKLGKYIKPEDFSTFLRQFFKLSFIYDGVQNVANTHHYRVPFRRNNLSSEEEIVIRFVYDDYMTSTANLIISSKNLREYCYTMNQFFDNLTADEIFRFIEIMEMHNMVSGFEPNLLINNILIIESLIVKDDKDLAKEFVRKTALFLINGKLNYELKDCICILDYLYNVRSDIVHGNTAKLFSDFSQLKENLPNFKYPSISRESKMHKKNIIIEFSYRLSAYILNDILKLWFSNPEELN